ncbi:hypothetical protein AGMMS50293_10190 [Spirochaetia bacterium]|nr:hypothetical protein AGMMS50293_10190 [Spirochaetia bacterium]
MNKPKKILVFLFFLACLNGFALDYGLVLNQVPIAHNEEAGEGYIDYTGMIQPWISSPLGEQADIFLSGGLTAKYEGKWALLPEVSRFELAYRPLPSLSLELGRFAFSDPLGFVFSGLFDGLGAVWDTGGRRIRAGALYTGLLYKKTAYITMTGADLLDFYNQDVYFASSRLAFAINWTVPSVFDSANQLDLGLLAQIDLNNGDVENKLHSQYALAKWSRPLGRGWYMELGGAASLEEQDGDAAFAFAFALSFAPFWVPSSRPGDRLFFNFRMASGNWSDGLRAFKPVTIEAQGSILRAKLSGLSWAQAGYSILLHEKIQGEVSAAWFLRTDHETFVDHNFDLISDSPSLGGEVYAGAAWVPESWISLNLGGGVFLPQGAYNSDAGLKWRVAAGLLLSF